jgi:hypothetical protein
MLHRFLLTGAIALIASGAFAQRAVLRGQIVNQDNNEPVSDATLVLTNTGRVSTSDADGRFAFGEMPPGAFVLVATKAGFYPLETTVLLEADRQTDIQVAVKRDVGATGSAVDIPLLTLDDLEGQLEDNNVDVANLLSANRDIYQSITNFNWFPFRFRERGYDANVFPLLLNGVPVNDPESGFVFFGLFGGLNDVLRNRESAVGMGPADFDFGGLGGATLIDTRAARQRQQFRVSYANANRSYRNRVMATYSTGLSPKGWAFTASASRRWAQEGYVPGTFFDGYAYFASVDKQFNKQHSLNATVIGAPTKRGRTADSFQEMFDIAGTNYYNPLWGFWNGRKRNASVATQHQPLAMLRYDFTPDNKTSFTVTTHTRGGRSSFTRLNWLDAPHPAPDFNRRLPSSLLDAGQQALWADQLSADEYLRQIDWFSLYDANTRNFTSVENADGIAGNTVDGRRALYMIEDQRSDNREYGFNLFARHTLHPSVTLNGGFNYTWYKGRNFKTIDDLLGADFWLDWDFYSIFDPQNGNLDPRQSDVRNPNNLVREGEIFGYNYDENIRKGQFWGQGQFSLSRLQLHAAAEVTNNQYWRMGYMQNGRFPENSLGKSDVQVFNTYSFKGGGVYKLNGRNYLYANGMYGTRAPRFQDTYLSPRTRDVVVPNIDVIRIQAIEGGYTLRAPKYRARITGYLTEFKNETTNIFASAQTVSNVIEKLDIASTSDQDVESFLNAPIFFGAAVLRGQDRRHMGIEAALEARPVPAWVFSTAGTIGRHVFTNRPDLLISLDNQSLPLLNAGQVYQKNFFVPRTPQAAASFSVKYEARKFWFLSLTANYAEAFWYDFDRLRRTNRFVEGLEAGSDAYNRIVDQIKAPAAFSLDAFGGKSWRLAKNRYIYFNAGITNLLNNQNIVVSGREAYRNAFRSDITDSRFYTSEILYAPGINYFASIAYRM